MGSRLSKGRVSVKHMHPDSAERRAHLSFPLPVSQASWLLPGGNKVLPVGSSRRIRDAGQGPVG